MNLFKNLKFLHKLVLFSGIFIAGFMVVLTTVLVANRSVKKHLELFAVASSANENFHQKEIDHLNWIGVLEDGILNNISEITIQTDPTQCKFGKFLYGPQRRELETLFPNLSPELKAVENPHEKLHKSAIEIVENWKQVHPGLKMTLCQRMNDHRVWLQHLSGSLLAGTEIDVQMNPTKCAFGKWINSEDVGKLRASWAPFDQKMEQITPLHEALHQSAKLISEAGSIEEKERIYNEVTSERILEVAAVFEEIYALEDTLMSGQEKALEVFHSKTHVHMEGVMEHLHAIGGLLDEDADAIKRDLETTTLRSEIVVVAVTLGIIAVGIGLSAILINLITVPIKKCQVFAAELEKGDFTKSLKIEQKDELGMLAISMNAMVKGLREGFLEIRNGISSMASSTTELSAISSQLESNADRSHDLSNSVATASEQTSHSMSTVASSVEQMSTNMRSVATASEEMTSTIEEIAKNTEQGKTISETAVNRVKSTSNRMNELGKAADLIGNITETIKGISDQTNLLALNATIEAASAGEAGKGFAVVANEIKELSRQTAQATEQISSSIENIQTSTKLSIEEIAGIVGVIEEIEQITSVIATAVEEQSNTTNEIARNVVETSDGVQEVSKNVSEVNSVSADIARDVNEVNNSATEIASASAQLNASAGELSQFAEKLNQIASRYKL